MQYAHYHFSTFAEQQNSMVLTDKSMMNPNNCSEEAANDSRSTSKFADKVISNESVVNQLRVSDASDVRASSRI